MKKLLLLALFTMIMVGCKDEEGRNYATDERGYTYEVSVIDSCEYFVTLNYMVHKGNCRFCIERNRKMIKAQIDTALIETFD
jgi:hypothetical protein